MLWADMRLFERPIIYPLLRDARCFISSTFKTLEGQLMPAPKPISKLQKVYPSSPIRRPSTNTHLRAKVGPSCHIGTLTSLVIVTPSSRMSDVSSSL